MSQRGSELFLLYCVNINLLQQAFSKDKQFTLFNVSLTFTAEALTTIVEKEGESGGERCYSSGCIVRYGDNSENRLTMISVELYIFNQKVLC